MSDKPQEFGVVVPAGFYDWYKKFAAAVKESGLEQEDVKFFFDRGHTVVESYALAAKYNALYDYLTKKKKEKDGL